MDRAQKAIIAGLIATSAIAWTLSINQPDMMTAMTTYDPVAISLFAASWTAGMAAMMFPAITPMVLLYNKFVSNKASRPGNTSATIQEEREPSSSIRSSKTFLFIGCYLLVWAITGIVLLLGWSVIMNNSIMTAGGSQRLPIIYGALLIIAGAYQFTPLKKTCLGYCESPLSFFMRRWKEGTFGAVKMGVWHGIYCLGCCWAYFLLMVALGWMNLLWMGLFAGIIFGEKMWRKGVWIARAAGIGLIIVGSFVSAGILPSLISTGSMLENNNGSMVEMTNNTGERPLSSQDPGTMSDAESIENNMEPSDDNQEMSDMRIK